MNQEIESPCSPDPEPSRTSVLAEFVQFLRKEKKWWLIPLSTLVIIALLLVLGVQSPSAPHLYPTQ